MEGMSSTSAPDREEIAQQPRTDSGGSFGVELHATEIAALPHLTYQRPGLERLFRGLKAPADLILERVSRLDAFSGYLFRT